MKEYLTYIVSVICAAFSGWVSCHIAKKQTRADIEKLEKQYALDLETEREKFKMEKEKLEIEHAHQLELAQKESESLIGNSILKELIRTPEVRNMISQEIKNSGNKHK